MKIAIFPGSFDPIHQGHVNILKKALKLFDKVILVVANNDFKNNQTDLKKRYLKIKKEVGNLKKVKVKILKNQLLADFARKRRIKFLVRSARTTQDFKYELNLAKLNQEINPELETIIFTPDHRTIAYSSSQFKSLKEKIIKNKGQ